MSPRDLPEMERTLLPTGPALPRDAGFVASEQDIDMMSGPEGRRPLRVAAGFHVDGGGMVPTGAATIQGCGRITLDDRFPAVVAASGRGAAILRPVEMLGAPVAPGMLVMRAAAVTVLVSRRE